MLRSSQAPSRSLLTGRPACRSAQLQQPARALASASSLPRLLRRAIAPPSPSPLSLSPLRPLSRSFAAASRVPADRSSGIASASRDGGGGSGGGSSGGGGRRGGGSDDDDDDDENGGEKKFPGFRFMAVMRDFGFGKFAFKEGAAGMFVAAGIGETRLVLERG
jgi:hypothetical protein